MTQKPKRSAKENVQFWTSTYEQLRRIWQQGRSDTVFISIDFETYEHNNDRLIEVGYSVFSPQQEQRTYHYVMKEALVDGLRNGTFVPCHRNKFRFGNKKRFPRLGHFMYKGKTATEVVRTDRIASRLENTINNYKRQGPVYLVFHNAPGDLKTLMSLGIDTNDWLQEIPRINPGFENGRNYPIYMIDTMKLFENGLRCGGKKGLEDVCRAVGVTEGGLKHFHNAGNDAHYTGAALIEMIQGPPLSAMRAVAADRLADMMSMINLR